MTVLSVPAASGVVVAATATSPRSLLAAGGLWLSLAGLAALTAESARRRDVAAFANGLGALALAVAPLALARTLRFPGEEVAAALSGLALWLAVAGLLHTVGMLGPYESVRWWDHLTHTISAALVATLAYGSFLAASPTWLVARTGTDPVAAGVAPWTVALATLAVTLGVGVWWEALEVIARAVGDRTGVDPLLVPYGRLDTALDLAFDAVGAVVILALDVRAFVPLARAVAAAPPPTLDLARWLAVALLIGPLAVAAAVLVTDGRSTAA